MKKPLGTHARHLPRYRPGRLEEDQRQIARAIPPETTTKLAAGSAGGDKRQLRGIPVVGSSTGAIPGTNPEQALLDQEDEAGNTSDNVLP